VDVSHPLLIFSGTGRKVVFPVPVDALVVCGIQERTKYVQKIFFAQRY
jgi:hypothetical protein